MVVRGLTLQSIDEGAAVQVQSADNVVIDRCVIAALNGWGS